MSFLTGFILGCVFFIILIFINNYLKKSEKENKTKFYCEVEQWSKCREQCKQCKKV